MDDERAPWAPRRSEVVAPLISLRAFLFIVFERLVAPTFKVISTEDAHSKVPTRRLKCSLTCATIQIEYCMPLSDWSDRSNSLSNFSTCWSRTATWASR
jgi:hypothetical protein